MKRAVLRGGWVLILVLTGLVLNESVQASSYLRTDADDESVWVEVSPIRVVGGEGEHGYIGPSLYPYVVLPFGTDLSHADLHRANLDYADLSRVNLNFTSLYRANLGYSTLCFSSLDFADLRRANLAYADLGGARMRNAWLAGAKWDYANVAGTDLRGADLSGSVYLGLTIGSPYYDDETDFSHALQGAPGSAPFDPEASGWTLLPEPSAGLLSIAAVATLTVLRPRRESI